MLWVTEELNSNLDVKFYIPSEEERWQCATTPAGKVAAQWRFHHQGRLSAAGQVSPAKQRCNQATAPTKEKKLCTSHKS